MHQPLTEPGSLVTAALHWPWLPYAVAGVMVAGGFVLWLAGRKLARAAALVLFGIVGTAAGWALAWAPTGGGGASGSSAGIILMSLMVVGGAVGAVVGWLAYRFAIAAGFSLLLAAVAGTIALASVGSPITRAAPLAYEEQLLDVGPAAIAEDAPLNKAETAAARVGAFLRVGADEVRARWEGYPARSRLIVAGATAGGAALGLLLGILSWRLAAAVVTSMLGSGLWLSGAWWLIERTGVVAPGLLGETEGSGLSLAGWSLLGAWGAATLIGTVVQWRGGGKPARESSE